ncbi:hypothetical protein Tco_1374087, partial [Tanacetum coccineum]
MNPSCTSPLPDDGSGKTLREKDILLTVVDMIGGYTSATATFMDNGSALTVSPSDSRMPQADVADIGDDSAANESVRMMRLY